ncbi:MAG: GFA family protein [Verrucomicrobia bacterium]|nr:GFA family protein [Verrucomicrobiota bacterium]
MEHSRGRCFCGDVEYELTAEPIALLCCHCTECQTASGSSFILSLKVPYGAVKVTKGEAKPYLRPEADGQQRCPRCLAALWSERLDSKEMVTVSAGTLDNSSKLEPVAHIWTSDKQPWIALPKGAIQFPNNPPSMEPIVKAWRFRNERNA